MPLHSTSDGTVECIVGWSAGIHAGYATEQAQASAVDRVDERRQPSVGSDFGIRDEVEPLVSTSGQ